MQTPSPDDPVNGNRITYAMVAAAVEAAGGKVRIPNLTLLRLQIESQIDLGYDPDGALTLTLVPRQRRHPTGVEL